MSSVKPRSVLIKCTGVSCSQSDVPQNMLANNLQDADKNMFNVTFAAKIRFELIDLIIMFSITLPNLYHEVFVVSC